MVHKFFALGVADSRGDFSLVSAICLWWDLGTLFFFLYLLLQVPNVGGQCLEVLISK